MQTEVNNEWKEITVDKLELSPAIVKALRDADVETAGQADEFPDLKTITGIANASESAIEIAIETLKSEFDFKPLDEALDRMDEAASDPEEPTEAELAQAKLNREKLGLPEPAVVDDEELMRQSDADVKTQFYDSVRARAAKEDEDGLYRMLAEGKKKTDLDIIKIANDELDKRFEQQRETQVGFQVDLRYSGLARKGYNSVESVSRYIHRQRISHPAGVALAKLHVAMLESGEKLKSGFRVAKKAHVIEKLLEIAYDKMKEIDDESS